MLVASSAFATVTFDPTCSLTQSNSQGKCGFVGKGDLQIPWGWNNQTAQTEISAGNVKFDYVQSARYDVTCEWDTVNRPGFRGDSRV
jgi:hypothetical protein